MESEYSSPAQRDAEDDHLIDVATEVTEADVFARKAKREAVERKLMAKAAGIFTVPVSSVVIWEHAVGRPGEIDLLRGNHAIGKLARQMETGDAARPFYRGSDHRRAA